MVGVGVLVSAVAAVTAAIAAADVGVQLSALIFRNNGTVTSDDVYVIVPQNSGCVLTSSFTCSKCCSLPHSHTHALARL